VEELGQEVRSGRAAGGRNAEQQQPDPGQRDAGRPDHPGHRERRPGHPERGQRGQPGQLPGVPGHRSEQTVHHPRRRAADRRGRDEQPAEQGGNRDLPHLPAEQRGRREAGHQKADHGEKRGHARPVVARQRHQVAHRQLLPGGGERGERRLHHVPGRPPASSCDQQLRAIRADNERAGQVAVPDVLLGRGRVGVRPDVQRTSGPFLGAGRDPSGEVGRCGDADRQMVWGRRVQRGEQHHGERERDGCPGEDSAGEQPGRASHNASRISSTCVDFSKCRVHSQVFQRTMKA